MEKSHDEPRKLLGRTTGRSLLRLHMHDCDAQLMNLGRRYIAMRSIFNSDGRRPQCLMACRWIS